MDNLFCRSEMVIKIFFLILLFRSRVTTERSALKEILRPQHQCVASMKDAFRIHGEYMTDFSKGHDQCMTNISGIHDQYIVKLDEKPTCLKDKDTESSDYRYFNMSEVVRVIILSDSNVPFKFFDYMFNTSDETLTGSNLLDKDVVLPETSVYHGTQYSRDNEFARCRNVSIQSIILLSTIIPAIVFTTLAISTYILLRYRRRKLNIKDKKERMFLVRENARDAKYHVFISYNSKDYDFLMEYVYDPLKQNLGQKTGTKRNLLCLGDRDFRLGKPVADEIIRCLEESAVFLILLSCNYCRSKYSVMEFEHALRMDKQMILMVKDEVNENEMTPRLRSYFRNNTRVLWRRRGNQYQLSTTWNNICTSILEVAPDLGDPNNV